MLDGIIIGCISFALIGLFHPIVIWSEYHFSSRCWPAFLLAGLALLAGSVLVRADHPLRRPGGGGDELPVEHFRAEGAGKTGSPGLVSKKERKKST